MPKEFKSFNSTIVKSASYDIEAKELVITFRLVKKEIEDYKNYKYFKVPKEIWEQMKKIGDDPTASIGNFVNSKIKPTYEYLKME